MNAARLLPRLLRNDARLVFRDGTLVMLSVLALVVGAAARFALPAIDAGLADAGLMPAEPGGLRFSDTFPLWVAFIGLWQAAVMPGTICGFLLLDEKEDRTLVAMRVVPVRFEGYLAYRVALPTVLAFALGLALFALIGHAPVPWGPRILLTAMAAPAAAVITLVLAVAALDKVQGFAFTKFIGVAGLVVLAGWFVPMPYQWGLAVFPPFAVCKAYWMAVNGAPTWWAPAVLGATMQAGLLIWLVRGFRARLPTS